MPISISMDHENADICVEFRGSVSPEDVQAYFKQLMSSFDSFAVFRSTNDAVGWLNTESESEPPG